MALLQNGKYFKADLSNYRVENGNLFINCVIYKDKQSRDFEKENSDNIKKFKENVKKYIQELDLMFTNKLKEINFDFTMTDVEKFKDIVNSNEYLKQIYELAQTTSLDYDSVLKRLSGEYSEIKDIEALKRLGLDENWFNYPIYIDGQVEINVGQISGEVINGENVYNKLKNYIQNTTDC